MIFGHGHGHGFSRAAPAAAVAFEAETTALLARFTSQPDATRQSLINACIKGLKDDGVWVDLHGLWLLAAHDAQAAQRNWKQDAYNLTVVGSPTFAANAGYSFAGSTADALQTGFSYATVIGAPAVNDVCVGGWVTAHTTGGCVIGHTSLRLITSTASTQLGTRCNDSTSGAPVVGSSDPRSDFTCVARNNGTDYVAQVGTEEATVSVASTTVAAGLEIGRIGTANTTALTGRVSFAFAASYLTKTQRDALRSRVRTYLTGTGLTLP